MLTMWLTPPLPQPHALGPNWRSPVASVTGPILTNGFLPQAPASLCWTASFSVGLYSAFTGADGNARNLTYHISHTQPV